MDRSRLFLLALAVGLQGVLAQGAAGQRAGALERARGQLPADAAARFDAIVSQARSRGLPLDPIVDKTLEGEAKGVPAEMILAVVQRLAGRLERARGLLDGVAAPADVSAVAVALDRGVPEDAVRRLAGRKGARGSLGQAVVTLGDLLQEGVPVNVAYDLVGGLLDRGASAAELRELPDAVQRLMREGVLPAQAAAAVAQELGDGHGRGAGKKPENADKPRGRGKGGRPPVAPGSGPPPGKGKPPKGKPPGHGPS
ncbi:MAG TPA: hypothetical protein VFQ38_00795 [Longimicrobiales bacterium]|nr:hypothetical protein [Longimicrobiales bacterium]